MAQQDTAKIEELRFRVKTDPRSRHFFPLAEELRKLNRAAEAEQVLRAGLAVHTTYLSGWVSLGRLLREQNKHSEAVEPLTKALQIDPGNVVAARLLADSYLALGEKVEAIKKYKLVHALLPADQELEAIIEQLEQELHPPPASAAAIFAEAAPVAVPEPPPYQHTLETPFPAEGAAAPEPEPPPVAPAASETPFESSPATDWLDQTSPFAPEPPEPRPATVTDEAPWTPDDSPLLAAQARYEEEAQNDAETGDAEPMSAAHTESPFENPLFDGSYSNDAFAVEQPSGMHVEPAPLAADVPAPWEEEPQPIETAAPAEAAAPVTEEADVFAPADESPFAAESEEEPFAANEAAAPADEPFPVAEESRSEVGDFADTITMADLYARQGLIDDARHIYEHILQRDPDNAAVREKLEALPAAADVPSVTAPFPAEEEEDEAPEPEPVAWQPPAAVAAAEEPEVIEEPQRNPRIERLENWLAKVARREGSRV